MRLVFFIATLLLAVPATAGSFEGWKQASVDVDADGRVTAVELVDELPEAMATVMQREIATWQFTPARIDGQAVSSRTHVSYALRAKAMDDDQYGVEIVGVRNGPRLTLQQGLHYPEQALRRSIQGTVYLRVWFGADGKVTDVEPADGNQAHKMLVSVAQRAVRTWRFEPEQVDGRPVAGRVVVPVQYCLELPGNTCRRSRIETVDGIPVRNDAGAVSLESAVKLESDVEGRLLQGQ